MREQDILTLSSPTPTRQAWVPPSCILGARVAERRYRARRACRSTTAFVRERTGRILAGGVSQVVKGLRQIATKRRLTGTKAKALRGAADYFYANRSRMAYDVYLANGWPIASGSVEATCKNLVRDRMERSGMRWCPTGAEAMLKVRAVYLSGDLDAYWAFHVQRDQQRLYPNTSTAVVAE